MLRCILRFKYIYVDFAVFGKFKLSQIEEEFSLIYMNLDADLVVNFVVYIRILVYSDVAENRLVSLNRLTLERHLYFFYLNLRTRGLCLS